MPSMIRLLSGDRQMKIADRCQAPGKPSARLLLAHSGQSRWLVRRYFLYLTTDLSTKPREPSGKPMGFLRIPLGPVIGCLIYDGPPAFLDRLNHAVHFFWCQLQLDCYLSIGISLQFPLCYIAMHLVGQLT